MRRITPTRIGVASCALAIGAGGALVLYLAFAPVAFADSLFEPSRNERRIEWQGWRPVGERGRYPALAAHLDDYETMRSGRYDGLLYRYAVLQAGMAADGGRPPYPIVVTAHRVRSGRLVLCLGAIATALIVSVTLLLRRRPKGM